MFEQTAEDCRDKTSGTQQRRFQLQKCAQQLVRLDDVAFAIAFVRINDPASPIARNGTAIAPRSTGSKEFVSN